MQFNPKVKDFLKEKPSITMIGFSWALYWRLSVAIALAYLGLILGIGILVLLFFMFQ